LEPGGEIILRFHNTLPRGRNAAKLLSGPACLFAASWALFFLCNCAGISSGPEQEDAFYIDLNEFPLYARNGFDPADITGVPDISGGSWLVRKPEKQTGRNGFFPASRQEKKAKRTGTANVETLVLPDMPRRFFLSPLKEADREYTMMIPFSVSPGEFEKISGGTEPLQPGVFLEALGDNWEIFFNGRLIKSEMRLDENGQIRSGRSWRYVSIPLDRSLFVQGTNMLAFHIVGAPHFDATGLWYENLYYIGDYDTIGRVHDESMVVAISAIYFFVALYHLLLFLSRRKDRYNIYYCLFSICLGIYFLVRSNTIYMLIPNSDITFRLEYASLYMLPAMLSSFLEHFNFQKTKILNKIYTGACLFCAVAQAILPNTFADDVLFVWWGIVLTQFVYILGYDILYTFGQAVRIRRAATRNVSLFKTIWRSLIEMPLGNIIIGAAVMTATAFIDIINSIFLRYGIVDISRYGIFLFTITTTVILARRFGGLFSQLDEMNTLLEASNRNLEATVRERTRELERQTEVAQAASRAKSDFLARMSHEIRTPLNAILGLSEVELQKDLPAETGTNLDKVYHSGAHLLEIVNDILDISKIESGNFEIIPAEYELSSVLNDAIQINAVRIGLKQLGFKLDLDETIPQKLYGDSVRIKQILNNLLSNAIKYTEEGEVRLSVDWEQREDQALVTFVVADTGRGIRKEDFGRLFSDYTQFEAAANRRIEGTGLGLSIARGLAETMGGTISVESEYGRGSVFRVSLPQGIVDPTPVSRDAVEELRNFRFIEDRSRSRGNTLIRSYMPYGKTLVVDDLQTNLDVMAGLLMPYGLRVDTVLSGQDAVDRIREAEVRYDLIFMDHMMPGMDGIEAVRIIRNEIGSPYAREIPIVALTANAVEGNREMFLNSGFNGFISKPIDIKQLDTALNQWIRDKQNAATLRDADRQSRPVAENSGSQTGREGAWLLEHPVEGIDFGEALELYGNSGSAYMRILKSFIAHTPPLLEKMDGHLETSLPDYAVEVHGLKGTCAAIGAKKTAELARELELASKAGNPEPAERRHGELRRQALGLAERLAALLGEWDAGRPPETKERRVEPERELLERLSAAAGQYNTTDTEEILEELERYRYERGEDLILSLREQAENFDYEAIYRQLDALLDDA
jgi:signal transduction histidine kinase/CheY-like chemotaxis protein/HPt (histidine-containing phosphotransfer) domain-containing protein